MKKLQKQLISIIMAVIMILTAAPMTVPAATNAGDFIDVSSDDFYYEPVLWAVKNKVTTGTTVKTFSPMTECTRGQIVTFLYKAGKGTPVENAKHFDDVTEGKYYYDPVSWAVSKEITSGTSDKTFSPGQSCTRAQAVTFLWKYAGSPKASSSKFDDVKEGRFYYNAVNWAVEKGITAGIDATHFSPNQTCLRSQIVTFLYRYFSSKGTKTTEIKNEKKVTVTFNSNGGSEVQKQIINKGTVPNEPQKPTKLNFIFSGWYEEPDFIHQYDFTSAINEDTTFYAKWLSTDTKKDEDNDKVPDYLEEFFDSDPKSNDTDKDGLTDYQELYMTGTEPSIADTDGNGILDKDEDYDADGITNIDEINMGTDPSGDDSDGDGLKDEKEKELGTNPLIADTDSDGASDYWEVYYGTDPLVAEEKMTVKKHSDKGEGVSADVELSLSGEQLQSLSVTPIEDDTFFPEDMPGYIGSAYNFSVDGNISGATISFTFDPDSLGENANPTIYYFNEESQILEPLETTIAGNVAKANVPHFSTYILIDRTVYESNLNTKWEDVWNSEENYNNVEVIFVVDDSGSMTSNDRQYERLKVARDLIDALPSYAKIGVVRFENSTDILTNSLTEDRDIAKKFLTTQYFHSSGGTYMYTAINKAIPMFESDDNSTLKMVIALSDGDTFDSSQHASTVKSAQDNNICIYTIGLGNSTWYFNSYLKPLAENTNGTFYLAANASELKTIYDNIHKQIDIVTDTDGDGLSDYYEDHMILFNGKNINTDKNNPDTDGDGLQDGEEVKVDYYYNEDKTKAIVKGIIKSNPLLPDTDYDGITDKNDSIPLEGYFKGSMGGFYKFNADYIMNFRDFFKNPSTYSSELSSASFAFANTVYGNELDYTYGSSGSVNNVTDLLKLHGFDPDSIEDYKLSNDYSDDDISEVGIGVHEVTYKGKTLQILAAIVRGTNGSVEEWSSNFDMGDPDVWKEQYHRGFYITEQRIKEKITDYIKTNIKDPSNLVIWTTGHSRGAAISNILAADLIDDGYTVYGYTYATPSVTTKDDANNSKYNSIINYVNTSDVIGYVPLKEWGFKRFGVTRNVSVEDQGLTDAWCALTGQLSYNAMPRSFIELILKRIRNTCAPEWSDVYDYSITQNIDDSQYASISERAKKYCKLEERKTRAGEHKGWKMKPSLAFLLQIGAEIISKNGNDGTLDVITELWNSKYGIAVVLFLKDAADHPFTTIEMAQKTMGETLVGDAHAPATYYLLSHALSASGGGGGSSW